MKRLISILAAAAFMLSGGVGVVSAHENPNNCGTQRSGYPQSSGYTWDRPSGIYGDLAGAQLEITANILRPCSFTYGSGAASKDFALVSLDGLVNGVENFPQLGLCKQVPPDQTYWCYMKPVTNPQGLPTWNPSWVQPLGLPVGGRKYQVVIRAVDFGSSSCHAWAWHYSITDLTTTQEVHTDISIAGASTCGFTDINLVGSAWYGCETGTSSDGYDANALDNYSDDGNVYMQRAGYENAPNQLGGVWHYTQNSQVITPALWTHYATQTMQHDQLGDLSTDRVWCYNTN